MLIQNLKIKLIWIFAALLASNAFADCDSVVSRLRTKHIGNYTLCELQSRYKIAIQNLKQMGVQDPTRIGNIFATRFMDKNKWISYLQKNGDSEFAAWEVYQPPKTFDNWLLGLNHAMNPSTQELFTKGSVSDIKSWFLQLHFIEMDGILSPERVGTFRTDVEEIIPLHFIDNAYTASEIESVQNTSYVSKRTGKKLMNFQFRICENMNIESTKDFYFISTENGLEIKKACGDLTMAPQEEVIEQMDLWIEYIQEGYRRLAQDPGSIDIVEFAAVVQQWFVVVHPFVDGNGRVSRLMMDLILSRFNLPAPVLDDKNQDFFTTPHEWADLIGQGIINSVMALEDCVKNPSALGCRAVSLTPQKMN